MTPTSKPRRPPSAGSTARSQRSDSLAAPLWLLLTAAAQALQAIVAGQSGSQAVAGMSAVLRPGSQALLFHALRHLGQARALSRQLVPRKPPPPVEALLQLVLGLACDEVSCPYPAHTLVDQAVEAAKRHPRMRAQAGLVNACLRRWMRDRTALLAACESLEARWNHPAWWIERLQVDYPDAWPMILQANQRQAPLTLRVNRLRVTRDRYLELLMQQGLEGVPVGPVGIALRRAVPVGALPHFSDGWVSVQDEAAQRAAPLLLQGLQVPGALCRVLDACAAPGGKTAHLLELGGDDIQVTALEVDAKRAESIHSTLKRLRLQAQVLVADAGDPASWPDDARQPYEGILLDAPCTASGIVRRHPDIRWLRRPGDIDQLAHEQARLLRALWPLVKPGGRLLYCTCSVFRTEGALQVEAFLAHNTDARLLPSPGHLLPGGAASGAAVPDNQAGDQDGFYHDGFYYALLEKRP
ncbi:MAG: 16S rRNA (cytosine(967)-C(5))-methyltransferase RsmB [Burkholderiaceae bacterium]